MHKIGFNTGWGRIMSLSLLRKWNNEPKELHWQARPRPVQPITPFPVQHSASPSCTGWGCNGRWCYKRPSPLKSGKLATHGWDGYFTTSCPLLHWLFPPHWRALTVLIKYDQLFMECSTVQHPFVRCLCFHFAVPYPIRIASLLLCIQCTAFQWEPARLFSIF